MYPVEEDKIVFFTSSVIVMYHSFLDFFCGEDDPVVPSSVADRD